MPTLKSRHISFSAFMFKLKTDFNLIKLNVYLFLLICITFLPTVLEAQPVAEEFLRKRIF
jgi:hypothetical protein